MHFGSFQWRDYAVEYSFRLKEIEVDTQVLLGFRTNSDEDTYRQAIFPYWDEIIVAVDSSDEGWQRLDTQTMNIVDRAWYQVRVEVQDTKIRVYVDDFLIIDTTASQYEMGWVSLSVSTKTQIQFDDVRIIALGEYYNTPALTNTPIHPIPTASPELLPIVGIWEGTTTGTNSGNPISERATTVSIPPDCQLGKECGFFSTEGACTYQLTLIETQDNVFEFESISISGADFCYSGDSNKDKVKITFVPDNQIFFHYETQPSVVIREGTLTKN
jgi:hypothetical protein